MTVLTLDEAEQAVALYVVLDRDPLDFLEMVAAAPAAVVFILHGMLTMPHPTSNMDLNTFGAELIDGIYRRHLAAERAAASPEGVNHG